MEAGYTLELPCFVAVHHGLGWLRPDGRGRQSHACRPCKLCNQTQSAPQRPTWKCIDVAQRVAQRLMFGGGVAVSHMLRCVQQRAEGRDMLCPCARPLPLSTRAPSYRTARRCARGRAIAGWREAGRSACAGALRDTVRGQRWQALRSP